MFWGILSKIYNIYSKKNHISTIIKPKFNLELKNNNLKIVSYNIDGLFAHYNHINYVNICRYLRYLFTEKNIDIICLQEVWEISIYNMIKDKLSDLNLYYAQPPTQQKYYVGESSGLLTISKYPITYTDFQRYDYLNWTCNMTSKGFQYLQINIKDTNFNIINTHLQCSFNKLKYLFQNNALDQMNIILNYLKDQNIENVLILGDLNLDTIYMINYLKQHDELNIPYEFKNNITFSKQSEQLDYFIDYNNLLNNKKAKYKIMNNIYYSDHYPIMLTINDI